MKLVRSLIANRGFGGSKPPPYGVVRCGNVGRGSRDVEGAVPYNEYLCEHTCKSKFEDRRWGSIFIAFTPLQKMEDMVKY